MIGLAIKIALGLAACGLSVLGAADLKVAFEKASEQGRRWWACITAWEASKILFALAALVLFVTNGAVTYASQKDSSEQATLQTDQLYKRFALADQKPEQASSALWWGISAPRAIKGQNYLLLSASH